MKFPLNKTTDNKKRILWGAIIALLFVVIFFKDTIGHAISTPIMATGQGMLDASQKAQEWKNSTLSYFTKKAKLESENERLNNIITELEAKNLQYSSTEAQNSELRNLLSRTSAKKQKYIAAAILKRPPEIPYDTLIIDAGSNDGISQGMRVTAYGEVLLGNIAEVFGDFSKVKLLSFPDNEINVVLSTSTVATSAKGAGSENIEISLPRSINISPGDIVNTPGLNGLVVGTIEKVESDPSNPFQKIFLRLPINIQQLKTVLVEK